MQLLKNTLFVSYKHYEALLNMDLNKLYKAITKRKTHSKLRLIPEKICRMDSAYLFDSRGEMYILELMNCDESIFEELK